jgi:hypothetical protein
VGIGMAGLVNAMVSHALKLGVFETVNGFEPTTGKFPNVHCSIWIDEIAPARSGLAVTSAIVTFNVRAYKQMPASQNRESGRIDVDVVNAIDRLMEEYTGEFTLDGLLRNVDLLGEYGQGLFAKAGYVEINGTMNRVVTINAPLVVNDVWTQDV